MSDLLPCCQCGESKGYCLGEGSTYRWWVVSCKSCGGDFGECAADRVTNLHKDPMPERWQWADEHWNECNTHAQGLRERIAELEGFARELLSLSDFQNDIDGGDFQDLAIKYGILKGVEVTEPCSPMCNCAEFFGKDDFLQTCYRSTLGGGG